MITLFLSKHNLSYFATVEDKFLKEIHPLLNETSKGKVAPYVTMRILLGFRICIIYAEINIVFRVRLLWSDTAFVTYHFISHLFLSTCYGLSVLLVV